MAIFSVCISEVQRSKGQNAVASIAYNARDKLSSLVVDPETGEIMVKTWDYRKLSGLSYSAIFAPDNAPDWVYDRGELWRRCEEFEARRNSQTARKMMIALPKELSEEQNILLVQEFVQNYLVERGMVVDINIHYDNPDNPHAHLQMTTRELVKTESGITDFSNHKNRAWGGKLFWRYLMEGVAITTNRHLELHGFSTRVSHLSHKARGIDLVPTVHEGPARHIPDSLLRRQNERIIKANAKAIMANPELVLDRLSINKPVFTKEEIATALMEALHNGIELDKSNTDIESLNKDTGKQFLELYAKVIISDQLSLVCESDLKGRVLYTKTKRLELEKRYIDTIEELNAASNHKLNLLESDLSHFSFAEKLTAKIKAITGINKGGIEQANLSLEQKHAVLNILNGADIGILEGIPGSGKTTAMREIVRQYKQAGYKIIGVAPSSSAALSLEQATGIESKNASLWRKEWLEEAGEKFDLILKIDYYKEQAYLNDRADKVNAHPQKQVMIIDEASMGELANMDYLLSRAKKSGSKVILVGDNNQFAAVGAAGALKKAIDICGSEKLYESRRQKNPEHQKATKLLGQFRVREALEIYHKEQIIKIDDSREETIQRLVGDYIDNYLGKASELARDDLAVGRNIVVCTYTNESAQMFNGLIRDKLKQAGIIKGKGSMVNIGGKELELCKNEQIVFTRNLNHLGRSGIYNGEVGTILSISSVSTKAQKAQDNNAIIKNAIIKVAVTKADKSIKKIVINTAKLKYDNQRNSHILDYGYGVTAHKLQGATVDQSLVFYEKQVGYEAFNVMMTRHRDTAYLYADRKTLHDNIYARMDLNSDQARKDYQITEIKTDNIDLIELNIGISRKVNNSFAIDYINTGLTKSDQILKEYMETSKQSIDLIREISKWQMQQERITGTKPQMHTQELWSDFSKAKRQRNNLARAIVNNYPDYQERITQLGINYATLEKRAYELKPYKIEERTSILHKESENYIKLTAAIKDNKPGQLEQIKQYYQLLRVEMVDNNSKLEESEKQLKTLKAEHDKLIRDIDNHKQYRTKLLPEYLQRVYRNSPQEVLSKWQRLSEQNGKLIAAEMVSKKPELLGKLHGIGFGKWLGISNKRIDAITNMENLGKYLKQYETSKEQENILDQKLGTSQYPKIKSILEQEIKYLKSLLPAKLDHEFINEVSKVLHNYNNRQNTNLTQPALDLNHLKNKELQIEQSFNKQQLEIVNTINQEIRHFKKHGSIERDGIKFTSGKSYLEHLKQDKLLAPYLKNTDLLKQLDKLNKTQQQVMENNRRIHRNMDDEFTM